MRSAFTQKTEGCRASVRLGYAQILMRSPRRVRTLQAENTRSFPITPAKGHDFGLGLTRRQSRFAAYLPVLCMKTTTTNPITNASLRCYETKDVLLHNLENTDLPIWSQCFLTAEAHTLTGVLFLSTPMDIRSTDDVDKLVAYLNDANQKARLVLDCYGVTASR